MFALFFCSAFLLEFCHLCYFIPAERSFNLIYLLIIIIFVCPVKKIETTYPSWLYPLDEVPPPYTSLMITVRALTYWGNSPHVRTNLHSPEGVPSPPSYPRAYVIFNTSPVDNRQVSSKFLPIILIKHKIYNSLMK